MRTAATNEKTESLRFGPACVTSSAPAARDKKPCAKTSSFPRRLPKMAEGQVGLCVPGGEGDGWVPGGSGTARSLHPTLPVPWDLRTVVKQNRKFF